METIGIQSSSSFQSAGCPEAAAICSVTARRMGMLFFSPSIPPLGQSRDSS